LRILFAHEARFGRINRPRPCWAPIGISPEVASQLIREYIYLYGAVSPKDGTDRRSRLNPRFLKPFVKGSKSDAADAEAIYEAALRPTMRFVPVKSMLGEYGVVLPQGAWRFVGQVPGAISDAELSDLAWEIFSDAAQCPAGNAQSTPANRPSTISISPHYCPAKRTATMAARDLSLAV
jgi:hypothetical protein